MFTINISRIAIKDYNISITSLKGLTGSITKFLLFDFLTIKSSTPVKLQYLDPKSFNFSIYLS